MSVPGRTTSFWPIVAQPATLMSVEFSAAVRARASTWALVRPPKPAVEEQAMNERRSISWPLAAQLLPVRRPSTIVCGRSLSVPLRTIV